MKHPLLLVLASSVILLAGCSSNADSTTPPESTAAAPTTTTSPAISTTDPPPTQPTSLTPGWTPDELAVIEALEAYRTEALLVARSPDRPFDALVYLATEGYAAAFVARIEELRSGSTVIAGDFAFVPLRVRLLDPVAAEVDSCELDRTYRSSPGGEVASPDPDSQIQSNGLRLVDGVWRFDGDAYGGGIEVGERCEL